MKRAMNNLERQGLQMIKDSGLSYEVKFDHSPFSGGFTVDIPALCGNYRLDQAEPFQKDLKKYNDATCRIGQFIPCDVCGSTYVIEASHWGKNCNRCHPL
jgi:hypothetical protein